MTEFEPFPRPFKTLLVSGWEIDRGGVTKEGIVRVSDTDDPNGRIVLADSTIRETLFPSWDDDDAKRAVTVVCVCILSREDVQQEIGL